MFELTQDQFATAWPLFARTRYGALTAATLQGTHPGRVFVDDKDHPGAGLVCTRAGIGYYFLAGQPAPEFLDTLHATFLNDFIPAQRTVLNNPEVLLFFDSPAWQQPLFSRFSQQRPVQIHKKRFMLRQLSSDPQSAPYTPLPDGMRVLPYSKELLAAQPSLAEEAALFYGSNEAFLEKSLGVCILEGEALASHCHAVFTGGGEAEISIATALEYRRRGLAYRTAQAFLVECSMRGLAPIWGCWPENEPSVALATRLGFQDDASQQVCLWVDDPNWNR